MPPALSLSSHIRQACPSRNRHFQTGLPYFHPRACILPPNPYAIKINVTPKVPGFIQSSTFSSTFISRPVPSLASRFPFQIVPGKFPPAAKTKQSFGASETLPAVCQITKTHLAILYFGLNSRGNFSKNSTSISIAGKTPQAEPQNSGRKQPAFLEKLSSRG